MPAVDQPFESLNFRELKCLARLLAIPGYSGLRLEAMLAAVKSAGPVDDGLINQAIAMAKGWKKQGSRV